MRSFASRFGAGAALFVLAAVLFLAPAAQSRPTFFASRCASCHSNDSQTCNGCHHHRGSLSAAADKASYHPGDPVTVTLGGGSQSGWIRGLLFDQTNAEIDRASGPTGTGDDGQGSAVVFPVTLQGTAPSPPGDYTWQAAWFGNSNNGGATHGEARTSVVIHVIPRTSDVPPLDTWSRIRLLFRR